METSSERQLVIYNPVQLLRPLQERERQLVLAGRRWTIRQDWDGVGVAAVVWEAVRWVWPKDF